MAKSLVYNIVTDPSKGIAGLKQFASAVKKTMGEVESSSDEAASSAAKVAKALSAAAGTIEAEMKGAAAAADALGKALGPEISGRADLDSIVVDLKRMGLTFEEITDDAELLAKSIKDLDRVQVDGSGLDRLGSAARRARTDVDDIGRSAGSSRSVLANLVGNASSDLAALAGVAGSAGVAIGQVGEYAADAASEGDKLGTLLTNFGKVAGPILGISVALQSISDITKRFAESNKRSAESVDVFSDALRSGEDAAGAYAESVVEMDGVILDVTRNQSKLTNTVAELDSHLISSGVGLSILNKLLGGSAEETKNITGLIDRAGISLDQFAESSVGGAEAYAEMADVLARTTLTGDEQALVLDKLRNNQEDSAEAARNHAEVQALLALNTEDATNAYKRFMKTQTGVEDLPKTWEAVANALKNIRRDIPITARQLSAINVLLSMGVPRDTIWSTAEQMLMDQRREAFEDDAAQLEEWASRTTKAFEDASQASIDLDEATIALHELEEPFAVMDRHKGAIEDAFAIGNAPLDALEATTDVHDALRDLKKFIEDEGVPNIFDPNAVDAGPFLQKIKGLRDRVQNAVGDAFATRGPEAAQATADAYVKQIVRSLDGALNEAQVRALTGLPPKLTTVLEVAVDQEALKEAETALDALVGLKGETPWTAQLKVALATGALSPEALSVILTKQFTDLGIPVGTSLLPPDEQSRRDAIREAEEWSAMPGNKASMAAVLADPDVASLVGAREFGQDWADDHPIVFPSTVEPRNGWDDFRNIFKDAGGTVRGPGGIVAEKRPEIVNERYLVTSPTWVPPGTRVTSGARTARILKSSSTRRLRRYDAGGTVAGGGGVTVNFNGVGAIGNRYDLMRVIRRGQIDKLRLLGSRG